MGLEGGAFRDQLVCEGQGTSDWDVRELSVVLDLVLEVAQLLDYLLPFVCRCRIGGLGNGAVGIVNSLSLLEVKLGLANGHNKRQVASVGETARKGQQTIITGHRSRAVVQPKEVFSEVE